MPPLHAREADDDPPPRVIIRRPKPATTRRTAAVSPRTRHYEGTVGSSRRLARAFEWWARGVREDKTPLTPSIFAPPNIDSDAKVVDDLASGRKRSETRTCASWLMKKSPLTHVSIYFFPLLRAWSIGHRRQSQVASPAGRAECHQYPIRLPWNLIKST